jgi:hypothetical protein
MRRKRLEQTGRLAVQLLRKSKLEQGYPFMINSRRLPVDQCYREFPDGTIQIVTICHTQKDFKLIRKLTEKEQVSVRKMLQLT